MIDKEAVKRFINGETYVVHNHIRITEVGEGSAVVEAEIHDESMNRWGSPHGGLLFSLGDMVSGTSALSLRGEKCVTLNASISYIAAVGPTKKLIATGHVTQSGSRTIFCTTEIRSETGRLAARVDAVMYCTGEKVDLSKY